MQERPSPGQSRQTLPWSSRLKAKRALLTCPNERLLLGRHRESGSWKANPPQMAGPATKGSILSPFANVSPEPQLINTQEGCREGGEKADLRGTGNQGRDSLFSPPRPPSAGARPGGSWNKWLLEG
ncbi:UNVERIFIED_CONTAM: hypothetical protein K2H54_025344 [Gekko kuhli]